MNKSIKSVVVLTAICLITAALLALVNFITAPIIEEAQKEAENAALRVVLPSGTEFAEIDADGLPESIEKVFADMAGKGYVFRINVSGYSKDMIILCGVDMSGTVTGATCLSSGETLGQEKTFGDRFNGINKDSIGSVDTVAGATKTTAAYKKAVSDALDAFHLINPTGGEANE